MVCEYVIAFELEYEPSTLKSSPSKLTPTDVVTLQVSVICTDPPISLEMVALLFGSQFSTGVPTMMGKVTGAACDWERLGRQVPFSETIMYLRGY